MISFFKGRKATCPLCSQSVAHYKLVAKTDYYECSSCDFIFADPAYLEAIDSGRNTVTYQEKYWESEREEAWNRAFGPGFARLCETMLFAPRPVTCFVDIGTGPGYILDTVSRYLPDHAGIFHGIEMFPPDEQYQTKAANYHIGGFEKVTRKMQAGLCVEVMEHLTPNMARGLAKDLAAKCDDEAFVLFNTGLTDFVRHENPGYLDPVRAGHISIWSVKAARKIFEPFGFTVFALGTKSFAFGVEYRSKASSSYDVTKRIWNPCAENKAMLHDTQSGSIPFLLGFESVRAYSR